MWKVVSWVALLVIVQPVFGKPMFPAVRQQQRRGTINDCLDACGYFEAGTNEWVKTKIKLDTLTLRYLGYNYNDLDGKANLLPQMPNGGPKMPHEKLEITNPGPNMDTVTIDFSDTKTEPAINRPKTGIQPGDIFTLGQQDGEKWPADLIIDLIGPSSTYRVMFHSSCSHPIEVGDIYGSLEIIGHTNTEGCNSDDYTTQGSTTEVTTTAWVPHGAPTCVGCNCFMDPQNNRRRLNTGTMIAKYKNVDLDTCAARCMQDDRCGSILITRNTNECQLVVWDETYIYTNWREKAVYFKRESCRPTTTLPPTTLPPPTPPPTTLPPATPSPPTTTAPPPTPSPPAPSPPTTTTTTTTEEPSTAPLAIPSTTEGATPPVAQVTTPVLIIQTTSASKDTASPVIIPGDSTTTIPPGKPAGDTTTDPVGAGFLAAGGVGDQGLNASAGDDDNGWYALLLLLLLGGLAFFGKRPAGASGSADLTMEDEAAMAAAAAGGAGAGGFGGGGGLTGGAAEDEGAFMGPMAGVPVKSGAGGAGGGSDGAYGTPYAPGAVIPLGAAGMGSNPNPADGHYVVGPDGVPVFVAGQAPNGSGNPDGHYAVGADGVPVFVAGQAPNGSTPGSASGNPNDPANGHYAVGSDGAPVFVAGQAPNTSGTDPNGVNAAPVHTAGVVPNEGLAKILGAPAPTFDSTYDTASGNNPDYAAANPRFVPGAARNPHNPGQIPATIPGVAVPLRPGTLGCDNYKDDPNKPNFCSDCGVPETVHYNPCLDFTPSDENSDTSPDNTPSACTSCGRSPISHVVGTTPVDSKVCSCDRFRPTPKHPNVCVKCQKPGFVGEAKVCTQHVPKKNSPLQCASCDNPKFAHSAPNAVCAKYAPSKHNNGEGEDMCENCLQPMLQHPIIQPSDALNEPIVSRPDKFLIGSQVHEANRAVNPGYEQWASNKPSNNNSNTLSTDPEYANPSDALNSQGTPYDVASKGVNGRPPLYDTADPVDDVDVAEGPVINPQKAMRADNEGLKTLGKDGLPLFDNGRRRTDSYDNALDDDDSFKPQNNPLGAKPSVYKGMLQQLREDDVNNNAGDPTNRASQEPLLNPSKDQIKSTKAAKKAMKAADQAVHKAELAVNKALSAGVPPSLMTQPGTNGAPLNSSMTGHNPENINGTNSSRGSSDGSPTDSSDKAHNNNGNGLGNDSAVGSGPGNSQSDESPVKSSDKAYNNGNPSYNNSSSPMSPVPHNTSSTHLLGNESPSPGGNNGSTPNEKDLNKNQAKALKNARKLTKIADDKTSQMHDAVNKAREMGVPDVDIGEVAAVPVSRASLALNNGAAPSALARDTAPQDATGVHKAERASNDAAATLHNKDGRPFSNADLSVDDAGIRLKSVRRMNPLFVQSMSLEDSSDDHTGSSSPKKLLDPIGEDSEDYPTTKKLLDSPGQEDESGVDSTTEGNNSNPGGMSDTDKHKTVRKVLDFGLDSSDDVDLQTRVGALLNQANAGSNANTSRANPDRIAVLRKAKQFENGSLQDSSADAEDGEMNPVFRSEREMNENHADISVNSTGNPAASLDKAQRAINDAALNTTTPTSEEEAADLRKAKRASNVVVSSTAL
eukprot:m.334442 g.334442  ORF g.334442 m.334442 type:complete len:1589 (+) comp17355_c0_seq1:281-5047(+)